MSCLNCLVILRGSAIWEIRPFLSLVAISIHTRIDGANKSAYTEQSYSVIFSSPSFSLLADRPLLSLFEPLPTRLKLITFICPYLTRANSYPNARTAVGSFSCSLATPAVSSQTANEPLLGSTFSSSLIKGQGPELSHLATYVLPTRRSAK